MTKLISFQIKNDDDKWETIGELGIGSLNTTSHQLQSLANFLEENPKGRILIVNEQEEEL